MVFRRPISSDLKPRPWSKQPSAQHSQHVHDCRIQFLSDILSIVLCFNRGRSRDFRLFTQIRRFASVCLARNIRISIRWIPSEFNSSDRGSREHDSENDPLKSLVDHLGSNDGQTFRHLTRGSVVNLQLRLRSARDI